MSESIPAVVVRTSAYGGSAVETRHVGLAEARASVARAGGPTWSDILVDGEYLESWAGGRRQQGRACPDPGPRDRHCGP